MADVFISYARVERDEAERIKARLEAMGLSVFLDVDGLDGGDVFSEKLDREVKTAGCVLGLWSPTSLTRPWVQIECDIGKRRGVLLPVSIHPFRDMDVPAPFWNIQFVDLTEALDNDADPNWAKLRRSLARTLNRRDLVVETPAPNTASRDPMAYSSQRAATRKSSHGLGMLMGSLITLAVLSATGGAFYWFDPLHVGRKAPPAREIAPLQTAANAEPATSTAPAPASTLPATTDVGHENDFNTIPNPPAANSSSAPAPPSELANTAKSEAGLPYRLRLDQTIDQSANGQYQARANGAFSPNGTHMAIGGKPVIAIDLQTKQIIFRGPAEADCGAPIYSKDGATIIAACREYKQNWINTVRVWKESTGEEVRKLDVPAWEVALSPDGSRLVAATSHDLQVLDSSTFAPLMSLKDPAPAGRSGATLNRASYSADGSRLLGFGSDPYASGGAFALTWNLATGAAVSRTSVTYEYGGAAFSPDGSLLVTGGSGSLRVVNPATGEQIKQFARQGEVCMAVVFSPDGRRFATLTWLRVHSSNPNYGLALRVWDTASLTLMASSTYSALQATQIPVFSRDGSHIATGIGEGQLGFFAIEPAR